MIWAVSVLLWARPYGYLNWGTVEIKKVCIWSITFSKQHMFEVKHHASKKFHEFSMIFDPFASCDMV